MGKWPGIKKNLIAKFAFGIKKILLYVAPTIDLCGHDSILDQYQAWSQKAFVFNRIK